MIYLNRLLHSHYSNHIIFSYNYPVLIDAFNIYRSIILSLLLTIC
jgi:hypothetical protein